MYTTTATVQSIVDEIINLYYERIGTEKNLYSFNRSSPYLFHDEISDIIRSAPDNSEITCYNANEIEECFRIRSGSFINECQHSVPLDEIIETIYEYLEMECGSVFINGTFITEFCC